MHVRSLSRPRAMPFAMKGTSRGNVSVSEQRRPLLLPQEVKELGRDRELLLYEGSRPILALEEPLLRGSVLQAAAPAAA